MLQNVAVTALVVILFMEILLRMKTLRWDYV